MEERPDTDPEIEAAVPVEPVEPADVIDLEIRNFEIRQVEAPVEQAREVEAGNDSLARTAGERAASLGLRAFQQGRSLFKWAADTAPGRVMSDVATGALEAITEDTDVQEASKLAEEQLGRVISVVVPVVVESLDPVELMERIDINEVLEAVDVNAILDRVDVNTLLDRVDVNALLDRVDVNALMDRADLNAILDEVDLDTVLTRVDLDAVLERVDLDAVLNRIDVAEVAKRAEIGDLVAQSTTQVAGTALDLGRRQAVALDTLLARGINRVLGRDSDAMPQGPPLLVEQEADTP